jgi:hypothetical protein
MSIRHDESNIDSVIPKLGFGIHEFLSADRVRATKLVDAKAKPWHDD